MKNLYEAGEWLVDTMSTICWLFRWSFYSMLIIHTHAIILKLLLFHKLVKKYRTSRIILIVIQIIGKCPYPRYDGGRLEWDFLCFTRYVAILGRDRARENGDTGKESVCWAHKMSSSEMRYGVALTDFAISMQVWLHVFVYVAASSSHHTNPTKHIKIFFLINRTRGKNMIMPFNYYSHHADS